MIVEFKNQEKLTNILGYWPSFHDSEVISFNVVRANPGEIGTAIGYPILTIGIYLNHTFPNTEFDNKSITIDLLITIRFHDVAELLVEGFNHQNSIAKLEMSQVFITKTESRVFMVVLQSAFGIGATFQCGCAEVVDVINYERAGTCRNAKI